MTGPFTEDIMWRSADSSILCRVKICSGGCVHVQHYYICINFPPGVCVQTVQLVFQCWLGSDIVRR